MEGDWLCIRNFTVAYQAEIARAVLEEQNIQAIILNKQSSPYAGVGEIEVYVNAEDAILAKIILDQAQL
ncbi:MAG: DUF2007 domain-containing protein [Bacteroidia bacterium]